MKDKIRIISFTETGYRLSCRMKEVLKGQAQVFLYTGKEQIARQNENVCSVAGGLKSWCADCFTDSDVLIFIGACGIAVRTIAPFVNQKQTDPAVLVADEKGKHIISLLSGHLGGGNAWTEFLAEKLQADPVITTASDVNQHVAVDVWAKQHDWQITDFTLAKYAAAAILNGEKLPLYLDDGLAEYFTEQCDEKETDAVSFVSEQLPDDDNVQCGEEERDAVSPLPGSLPVIHNVQCDEKKTDDIFSEKQDMQEKLPEEFRRISSEQTFRMLMQERKEAQIAGIAVSIYQNWPENVLRLVPRQVILGIGCRKGKNPAEVKAQVNEVLSRYQLSVKSIANIASIDLKAEEQGILQLAEEWDVPFVTFSAEELSQMPGEFAESDFVKKTTGVGNVCERAALAALPETEREHPRWICRKQAENGVTVALVRCTERTD